MTTIRSTIAIETNAVRCVMALTMSALKEISVFLVEQRV
jgi:hypothetical protein